MKVDIRYINIEYNHYKWIKILQIFCMTTRKDNVICNLFGVIWHISC